MPKRPALHVVGAAILRGGRCFVAQRGAAMALAGRWEFVGGKVERGERPEAALAREVREELGLEVEVGGWLGRGESRAQGAGGRAVVLDVYAARVRGGALALHEHAEAAWCTAAELDGLAWAEADVPVVPAVQGAMRGAAGHRLAEPAPVLCADWSGVPRRRAVVEALPRRGGWRIAPCPPPAEGWSLRALLARAEALRAATGRAPLVGVDAALGIPRALARAGGFAGFREALTLLAEGEGLRREAQDARRWSPATPFFRVPPGRGALRRFEEAAGGRTGLRRQIELRTAAKPAFVLSGIPGAVGSATRALWTELAGAARGDVALWPFDGGLAALSRGRAPVLAEVYPRAAYALATVEALPARPRALAKTKAPVRAQALRALETAAWVRRHRVALADPGAAAGSEDVFDALLTAAALVRAIAEGEPLSCALIDPVCEGGILGTHGLVLGGPP